MWAEDSNHGRRIGGVKEYIGILALVLTSTSCKTKCKEKEAGISVLTVESFLPIDTIINMGCWSQQMNKLEP